MVVADPEATLLTVCANGYGKRTPFGPNSAAEFDEELRRAMPDDDDDAPRPTKPRPTADAADESRRRRRPTNFVSDRYRTQRRGGKGLRDIKTTDRNGPVVGIVRVSDDDELLMMTARGKIQRIAASDISIIGRNTQGVKIMSLDEDDTLVAVKRVPEEEERKRTGRGRRSERSLAAAPRGGRSYCGVSLSIIIRFRTLHSLHAVTFRPIAHKASDDYSTLRRQLQNARKF